MRLRWLAVRLAEAWKTTFSLAPTFEKVKYLLWLMAYSTSPSACSITRLPMQPRFSGQA